MIQEKAQAQAETTLAGLKTAPAIGGAVATGLTLNEWVALATLLYVILQVGLLIPKYVDLYKKWREKK